MSPDSGSPTEAPWQPARGADPGTDPDARAARSERSGRRNAVEWIVIGVAAVVFAVLVKTFLVQAFYIPSESMHPTLKTNDRVLVNKLSYRLHDIHRGDIIVFNSLPNDGATARDLIKRVVGLPGETVEARDGHVLVDGRALKEEYLDASIMTDHMPPMKIPAGHYWVMGDNRSQSRDSRYFGPVPRSAVIGRAFVRLWPLSALTLL